MGINTATYTTPAGTLTIDRSEVPRHELAKLDRLQAAGMLQPDDVLQFLKAHPEIKFLYVSRDELEPPEDLPDEEIDYDGMSSDLNAILAQAQRALMRANQGLRRTLLENAMAQREQIMDEAKQGLEKDLKAAQKNYDAAVASAVAEGVAGGIQIGFAGKGMKDMRRSAKLSKGADRAGLDVENLTTAKHDGLSRIKKDTQVSLDKTTKSVNKHIDRAKAEDKQLEELKVDRARQSEIVLDTSKDAATRRTAHAKKTELKAEIEQKTQNIATHNAKAEAKLAKLPDIQKAGDADLKAFDDNMTKNISRIGRKSGQDTAEADRLVKRSMVWGQLGGSVGQILNSLGKGVNAQESLAAAQLSAYSKMDSAEKEMASMQYQQLMDLANAARDVINDMRNMQSSTSQSTQQLQSSIARNMA